MKNLLLWLLFPLCCLGQNRYSINFSTLNGLPSNTVYDILQDKNHFIWIATSNGLVKFDGANHELFNTDNGLPDNEVLRIKEDSQGRLWLFCINARPCFIQNNKIHHSGNTPFLAQLPKAATVYRFFEELSKDNYLIGETSLWQIKGAKVDSIISIKQFINGPYDVINKLHSNKVVYVKSPSNVKINGLVGFFEYTSYKGKSYFYSRRGIFELVEKKGRLGYKQLVKTFEKIRFVGPTDSKLIVLIPDNPISEFEPKTGKIQPSKEFEDIPAQNFSKLISDIGGNLWVGTLDKGLFLYPKNKLLEWKSSFQEGQPYSLSKVDSTSILVGLENSKAVQIDLAQRKQPTIIPISSELIKSYNRIKNIQRIEGDSFIFCSDEGIGFTSDNFKTTKTLNPEHVFKPSTETLKEIERVGKHLYIVCSFRRAYLYNSEKNEVPKTIFNARSNCSYVSPEKEIYLGTMNGVKVFDSLFNQKKTGVPNLVLDVRINDISGFKKWIAIATDQMGLVLFNPQKGTIYLDKHAGFGTNQIVKLYAFQNEMFAATTKGVFKIIEFGNSFSLQNLLVGKMPMNEHVRDFLVDSNSICFITNKGFYKLNRKETEEQYNLKPSLFALLPDSSIIKVENGEKLSFKPGENNLSFRALLPWFEYNGFIQYGFALIHDGDTVNYVGLSPYLSLNSLANGSYRLKFRGSVIGTSLDLGETELTLVIQPYFYQTTWFLILILGISIFFVVWTILFFYSKSIQKGIGVLQQQKREMDLELTSLRSQISPHFIFNSISAAQFLVRSKRNVEGSEYLRKLALYFRKALDYTELTFINLDDELNFLSLYLELETIRYPGIFKFSIFCEIDEPETIDIPAMLLQPYIENAIRHGIRHLNKDGEITIRVYSKERVTIIELMDNGPGIPLLTNEAKSDKIKDHKPSGLLLSSRRIALFNKYHEMNISLHIFNLYPNENMKGTCIQIRIPDHDQA